MLKTLLKKQFMEIFRSYFYDAKRKRARNGGVWIILAYLATLIFVGGIFAIAAAGMAEPLLTAGLGWMYFCIFGVVAVALGAFGSVFNTHSALYLAKDNDLLLSMPIPARVIILARLAAVYLMGLIYSAMVLLPAAIVYWCVAPFSVGGLLGPVVLLLLVSLLVLVLSCLLGWVVAKISVRLKNRSFITVLASLLFIAVYYFVYFRAQEWIAELVQNAALVADVIRGRLYPLYLFGRVGQGDALACLLAAAVVGLLFALTWRVMTRGFFKLAASANAVGRVRERRTNAGRRSVSSALFGRELKRFTSSANYMLNCGMGILFLPVAAVALLLRGSALIDGLLQIFGAEGNVLAPLALAALCLMASMNDMAAPSVSLEGKTIWLAQSLPVTPWQVLRAKLRLQLLLTTVPVLVFAVCLLIVLPMSFAEGALLLVDALLFVVLFACIGLSLGVRMANLTWTNELTPIKQSAPVVLALFGGWIYAIVVGGLYLVLSRVLGAAAYLGIVGALSAAAALLLYRWLKTSGAARFASL